MTHIATLKTTPALISAGEITDAQAVVLWLRARGSRSERTFDAYRREASRLLRWAGEQGTTLSDLTVEDTHRYFQHLTNPPAAWVARLGRQSKTHLAGPLSARSLRYTRTVLSQLFGYLQEAGFVANNVFKLSPIPAVADSPVIERTLDLDAWRAVWAWAMQVTEKHESLGDNGSLSGRLNGRLPSRHAARARWVLALLYHAGLRRSEAVTATFGDFLRQDGQWLLRVHGKGNKPRFVTVNSALAAEMVRYRRACGLRTDLPTPGDPRPLIASVQPRRASLMARLTPRALDRLVQAIATHAAQATDDPILADRIARMTPHWLRHTHATHRLLAGASLETTQDEMGHADPRTTRLYAKTADSRRRADAERLAELSPGG